MTARVAAAVFSALLMSIFALLFWQVVADYWNRDGFVNQFCYRENGEDECGVFQILFHFFSLLWLFVVFYEVF